MSTTILTRHFLEHCRKMLHCTHCGEVTTHDKVPMWSDAPFHCTWCNTLHTATDGDIMSSTAEHRR